MYLTGDRALSNHLMLICQGCAMGQILPATIVLDHICTTEVQMRCWCDALPAETPNAPTGAASLAMYLMGDRALSSVSEMTKLARIGEEEWDEYCFVCPSPLLC